LLLLSLQTTSGFVFIGIWEVGIRNSNWGVVKPNPKSKDRSDSEAPTDRPRWSRGIRTVQLYIL